MTIIDPPWDYCKSTEDAYKLGFEHGAKQQVSSKKKGHWYMASNCLVIQCSECGKTAPWFFNNYYWDYCPNCGTKMDVANS